MHNFYRFIGLLSAIVCWVVTLHAQGDVNRGLVTQITVSGSGEVIAVKYSSSSNIDVIDTNSGNLLQTIQIPANSVERIAISPNGSRIIWTGGIGDIHLYNVDSGISRTIFAEGAASMFDDIYWSTTDESVIAWTLGRRVNFYNLDENEFIGSFLSPLGHVVDMAFSPDGSLVATSHFVQSEGNVGLQIWETPMQDVSPTVALVTLDQVGGSTVDWSNNGELISIIGPQGFSIYNFLQDQIEIASLGADLDDVFYSATWSPDDNFIATGGDVLRIWNVSDYTVESSIGDDPVISEIVWSPDGQKIFTNGRVDSGLRVSDSNLELDTMSILQLTSFCSSEINNLRVWKIYNTNSTPINFTWNVIGTDQTGSATVPGGSEASPGEITFETMAVAASDTVTISVDGTVQDTVSSDSAGVSDTASLITAITDANNSVDINTVCLADGTYTLTASQVTDYGTNGLPLITSDITLVGLGDNVVIERELGAPAFRLLHVKDTGALTLENVTLSNGDGGTTHGGAIYARGPVTLRDVTITDNFARRGGGVRMNGAPLTITGSTFQGNTSDREGGAIYISGTDVNVDLSTSQFISNSTQNSGGAVYLSGTATTFTADDVFFQSNQAKSGGAIFAVPATLDITNSTFDSNNASQNDGGAIYTSSSSTITVANSTFTLNGASDDGGALRAGGNVTLTGSTFTGNFSAVGAGVYSQNAATITGNRIETNIASELGGGLYVSHNSNTHSVMGNCISGNTAPEFSGLFANTSSTNATGNYWGAADGPGGSGPGSGDTVNSRGDFAGFLATCPLD
jgi:predicted outer membrane repeat protein